MKEKDLFRLSLIASLTLGLAPFVPEPHIWKQILNLTLGRPMYTLDWIDVAMHGAPWLLFIIFGIRKLTGKANS
jgi:hypothetical protein